MGRIAAYLTILSAVLLGLHFAGMIENTPISFLLGALKDPQNFINSPIATIFLSILSLASVTAIVIGTFSRAPTQWILAIGFVSLLLVVGWDLIVLFNVLKQINTILATFIISPLIVLYVLSLFEWWNARD